MLRLGLALTLRSGREALVRLLVTAAAVAVGVALLLGVLAEFHAFQSNADQPCWSCTTGPAPPTTLPGHGDLWNDSVDFYQGQTITRLDIASLGTGAPVPPGVPHLPRPGQYYASPALASLLRTVPAGELGDRFPGHLAGTIGQAALNGANDLVIYIGYPARALTAIHGTRWVTAIATAPAPEVFTPFFRYAFGIGVLAVLFPVLVLIATATRLAADRREERFAALRLVGGTPADIRVIASVESVVSAFCGAVLGTVVFLLVRPLLAGTALVGTRYFESALTPTVWGYVAMLAGVPVAAAAAALLSLRRVQISPLGVSRRATPKAPAFWRLATLAFGVALYVFGLTVTTHKSIGAAAYPGLLVTMIGLVIAGPWFTAVSARLFGAVSRGPAPLLAARRLADNPRLAFRSVTGLVLAVFLGTMVGALLPSIESIDTTPNAGALSNVLVDTFANFGGFSFPCGSPNHCPGPTPRQMAAARQRALGLSPRAGRTLLRGLGGIAGATAYPLYSMPQDANPNYQGNDNAILSCSVPRGIPAFGRCASGAKAIEANDIAQISGDNPRTSTAAFVSPSDPAYAGSFAGLSVQAVLVKVNSPAALERVRTFLAVHTPPDDAACRVCAPTPPRTYGEQVAIRSGRAVMAEKIVYAAVALTLIVAGCSLAVSAGGGLVDRKRPFTLLRVSGTPAGVLTRVVLLEAAVPLVAATLVAAGIAYGTSILAFIRLAPAHTAVPQLGHDYYALMGAGLVVAFGVITVTLPLLRRMTAPATARFE